MLKSSSLTFVFIYIFPVFMLGGAVFGIYSSWIEGTPESLSFAKSMTVMTLWISFFLIQMPFRLKYIEAHEDCLQIKSFGKQFKIEYRDIYWISKFDLTSPWSMTIKYRDNDTGFDRKISFMPSQNDQRLFHDDAMTEFIKYRVKEENSNFSEDQQPSTMKNFLFLFLLSLPFIALTFYFMKDSIMI